LLATALQAVNGGSDLVLLTLVGGGAFANAPEGILVGIRSALEKSATTTSTSRSSAAPTSQGNSSSLSIE
jgi:hypothetical protein